MSILIKGGTIVAYGSVFQADVMLEDGVIAQIGSSIAAKADQCIDATGKYILPGAIDAHTHFDLDAGSTMTADDFYTGSLAAIKGGTTTVIDFATQSKGATLLDAFAEWQQKAAGKSFCDYGFHMAITDYSDAVQAELGDIIALGISTFKVYMAYKGNLQMCDEDIYHLLVELKRFGGLLGVHCENGDLICARTDELLRAGHTSPYYHMVSRPPIVEAEAIHRLLVMAELTSAPVWVVHLSTASGLQLIQEARGKGIRVVAETCPQYLIHTDEKYGNPTDTSFEAAKHVMSPPLRSKSDRQALWQGLKGRTIDFISTDHCSFNYHKQKEMGKHDFSKIPNGAPGVEDRLLLIHTYGVCENKIDMATMVHLLSENPAKLMGLSNKGSITVGKDADVVIFDPTVETVFSQERQAQNVDYNAYDGMRCTGKIEHVFLRGTEVMRNGVLCGDEPDGQYQPRQVVK